MSLRPSLLFREVVRKIGSRAVAHIGLPVSYEELAPMTDCRVLTTAYLRERTCELRGNSNAGTRDFW